MDSKRTTNEHAAPPNACAPPRRGFLGIVAIGLSAIAGVLTAIPFVGYVVGSRKRRVAWVKLGPVGDFSLNQTRLMTFDNPLRQPWDGITSQTGVFVRYQGTSDKQGPQFLVLSVNCAHLGCPVSWFPQSELFLCPCHGGVYYADGSHASGPPPRGLFHCEWRVREGVLEVQAPHYPTLHDTLRENG
jgi:Rieske Fe-S protein